MSKGDIRRFEEGDSQAYETHFKKARGRKKFNFKGEMKEEYFLLKERDICQESNAISATNLVAIDTIFLKDQMI